MDGKGICESMQSWGDARGVNHPGMQKLLDTLLAMRDRELPGVNRFLDARQYLVELGLKERYDQLNPVFSKLVHPTSWSVHWKQELLDKTAMRGFIISIGTTSSLNIITAIRGHMKVHGLEVI